MRGEGCSLELTCGVVWSPLLSSLGRCYLLVALPRPFLVS